ncbi:MAG: glycoside hydrolase family 3 N-terminal domain-containing protein [Campylobacterota bacterium]|nr:glycoside hydrolase family 3 N-terminal domain-containing protein [Campylobacterota bacterium]
MIRIWILICILLAHGSAHEESELKKMIGRMLVVGFEDERLKPASRIIKQINDYDLGGVILFDRFYTDRNRTKNIRSPKQLHALTQQLNALSHKPLLIALDQEGGKVARLKEKYGFGATPSAQEIAEGSLDKAEEAYKTLAKTLHENGINCNFAPVVDLALNPHNKVIYQLERSYGSDPLHVSEYALSFIDALRSENVLSVLKHFPGHGSSLGDSHKGFVDVSDTWKAIELEPYKMLIAQGKADMIMTAHVYNSHLDQKYPATLSHAINTKLLRETLGFQGVIISDDLQMKAISQHYSLKETVTLAINSGVDILLFGNQLASEDVDVLIETIYQEVKKENIALARIQESNQRINSLHVKRKIRQMPIDFKEERIAMTKQYIDQHYGLHVKNINIDPKVIVLHWTAIDSLEDSYQRLKPQKLYSDRKDIVKAGALNVSAHFLVDRDGTIYQLMPDNIMARHVIGLNYSSIGIENIGGEDNIKEDLTEAQVQANIDLVTYLTLKYPNIEYLIGHHEYRLMEKTALWLERDAGYRTQKRDPGEKFMNSVRQGVKDLRLKAPRE